MKRGFMNFAVEFIKEFPGQPAQHIVEEVLSQFTDASVLSDAQDPVASLTATLNKQVQTGQEKRIRRERIGGLYRYFPVSVSSTSDPSEDVVVQLSLPTQELKDIDNLVAVDKFGNRSNAIKWLVVEGIRANRGYLDKVADARDQIERLKREI